MKEKYPDSILFFRLGDFYEMFFDDALEASGLLQITLTARNKGDGKAPMCGVPYHAADQYISKLTKLGKKVAICEQLTDPGLPGIVERGVVRVITPGTTLDENVLDQKTNNFVAAVLKNESGYSISYADLTTGEFKASLINDFDDLAAEIGRINPAEIIIPRKQFDDGFAKKLRSSFNEIFFFPYEPSTNESAAKSDLILIEYFKSTQKSDLKHVSTPLPYTIDNFMPLDEAAIRNLEILFTMREGKKEGSLLWVLDRTITAMGGRLLRSFLTHPLINKPEIDYRLDSTEELIKNPAVHDDTAAKLKSIMDLERLLSRLSLGRGNARDLIGLKNSLNQIPAIKNILINSRTPALADIRDNIDPLSDLTGLINNAVLDDPPVSITDGDMIKDGYNAELDSLRKISREGKQFIQNLQRKEAEQTGIGNLKVRYNKVFGYYIEVSKSHISKVPPEFIRKQTLVNAERYITPELKEFEEKILGAQENICSLEQKIFSQIRDKVLENIQRIQETAKYLAMLDVLCSYATCAMENNYTKPCITTGPDLEIVNGRHPVVEKMSTNSNFIPNDSILEQDGERLLLLTGPNMGGKSTYLRQTALIVLMAQIGSFVPAEKAEIGLIDRIFTRVGASDNLVKGQSTFMVEMQETSYILKNATERSLVILDEVGRGTSTYDGMSIAWAILEYLHDKIRSKTLFATHYHELISLASKLNYSANYAVAVSENSEDGVVFLYKVVPGGVNRSYGIEVAKLAGLPGELITRANQILIDLEEGVHESAIQKELRDSTKRIPNGQMGIFQSEELSQRDAQSLKKLGAVDELQNLDLDSLTPLQALNKLNEIKKKL